MTLQCFLQHACIAGVDLDELRLAESLAAMDLPFSLAKWQIKLRASLAGLLQGLQLQLLQELSLGIRF